LTLETNEELPEMIRSLLSSGCVWMKALEGKGTEEFTFAF